MAVALFLHIRYTELTIKAVTEDLILSEKRLEELKEEEKKIRLEHNVRRALHRLTPDSIHTLTDCAKSKLRVHNITVKIEEAEEEEKEMHKIIANAISHLRSLEAMQ